MGNMERVHIFISTGRFRSFDEMRAFIEETYSDNGDAIRSPFICEVDLSGYEPACIEALHSGRPVPLTDLLRGSSYSEQWLSQVDGSQTADSAICVFAPNRVGRPVGSSLQYIGPFEYRP